MESLELSFRREQASRALLPLFFASGATGLVYQTLWARELHLVFGTSSFAISAVLTSFMAGLAIGGWWASRYADRVARPLAAYGWFEIGIGLYALLFPWLVLAVEPIYLAAWRALEPGPVLFGAIQLVLLGTALLLPTSLMGATLPLLARFATLRLGAAGDRVGTLYGVNTAGAVFGTWLGGFVLLPALGLTWTTVGAAAANVVLGVIALAVSRWASGAEQVAAEADLPGAFHPALRVVALVAGLAGFASLVYEIAFTRVLVLMLGASVYAFSVMLLAFLIGIAAGGKAGGWLADFVLARGGQTGVMLTLAGLQLGVGLCAWLLMYVFPELPFWYVWLFDDLNAIDRPGAIWWVSLLVAGVVMTPPALLMGASFPVAVRAVTGETERLGGSVGAIYGANTTGSLLGAAFAGFVMLPNLGVQGTMFVGIAVNLCGALVLCARGGRAGPEPRLRAALGVATLLLLPIVTGVLFRPPWNPLLMTAGMYKYVSETKNHTREGIWRYAVERYELLYYAEGLSSVVTVAKNRETGNLWLANNGKVDASTSSDMPTQVLVALLPFLFVDKPDDVLIIGLASGITAGSALTVGDVGRAEVVELEPAIVQAAELFKDHNHDVVHDPKVRIIANDGRNHVLLAEPGSWDIVVSEPSNPWLTGVSNLFTREFFELGKTRLKPGGVWSQWVQMYGMGPEDLRSLLKTFTEVYPHVLLFATIEDADLVLVGSESPLEVTPDRIAAFLRENPAAHEELTRIDMREPIDLMAVYVMDRDAILRIVGDADLNTDDNMRIEYNAPKWLHRDTSLPNMEIVVDNAVVPVEEVGRDPIRLAKLARRYLARDDFHRSMRAMAHAVDAFGAREGADPHALMDNDDWGGALKAIIARAAPLIEREPPPIEFLDEYHRWQEELAIWAQDDGEDE